MKDEKKNKKLERLITIRLTNEFYSTLHTLSENKRTSVSAIIRDIVSVMVDMVKE